MLMFLLRGAKYDLFEACYQIALAIKDEVQDLEKAGNTMRMLCKFLLIFSAIIVFQLKRLCEFVYLLFTPIFLTFLCLLGFTT